MGRLLKSLNILILALIICSLFFQGCASTREIMDSWIGHHQSDLIAQWGPPERTASDGKGGQTFLYERFISTGYGHGYIQSIMFYADENGYIYHWRTQGL